MGRSNIFKATTKVIDTGQQEVIKRTKSDGIFLLILISCIVLYAFTRIMEWYISILLMLFLLYAMRKDIKKLTKGEIVKTYKIEINSDILKSKVVAYIKTDEEIDELFINQWIYKNIKINNQSMEDYFAGLDLQFDNKIQIV